MQATQHPSERRRWLSVILGFVAIEATAFSLRGALVPRFVEIFETTTRSAGLLAPAATAGFVATLVLTGLAATSADTERLLAASTAVAGLCFVGAAVAPTFGILLIALFGRGIATGVFRGLDRPLLSMLYDESRERIFNYYDLAWAGGAALAPGLSVLALQTVGWRPVYAGLAAGCFALTGLALTGRLDFLGQSQMDLELSSLLTLASSARIRRTALAMFFLGGFEGGLFTWLPLYTTRSQPGVSGAAALTALLVAYIPGRFLHASLTARVETARYLIAIAGGALLFAVGMVLATDGELFLAAIVGMGVLLAGVFPTTIALAVGSAPGQAGPLNAGLTAVAYLGIAIWPPLAGHVAFFSEVSLLTLPIVLGFCLVWTLHDLTQGDVA